MEITSAQFKKAASSKRADAKVQAALANAKGRFVVARARAIQELDNFEEIRQAAADLRDHCLSNLDQYLEEWERNATAAGTVVHWVESAEDMNRAVLEIARSNSVKKIIKSKSMLGE